MKSEMSLRTKYCKSPDHQGENPLILRNFGTYEKVYLTTSFEKKVYTYHKSYCFYCENERIKVIKRRLQEAEVVGSI